MLERCSGKTRPVDRLFPPSHESGRFPGRGGAKPGLEGSIGFGRRRLQRRAWRGNQAVEDKGTKSMGMLLIPSSSAAIGGVV